VAVRPYVARGRGRVENKQIGGEAGRMYLDVVRERGGRRAGRGVRQDDPVSLRLSRPICASQHANVLRSRRLAHNRLFFLRVRVQGRLDPEGVAEDGRRRREGVRRVGAGELLRGSFSPP
jgi:hypothetical protein